MKRRGLRLEVDEPSERQERNKRWLANHPVAVAVAGAVVCGLLGLLWGVSSDASWASPPVGAACGLALGALIGGLFSVENRGHGTRGLTLAMYGAGLAVVVGVVLVLTVN